MLSFTGLAHRLVAHPWVYDQTQKALGYDQLCRLLRPYLQEAAGCSVLEVGAGTGNSVTLLPPAVRYLWSDNDPQKLAGYRAKFPGGRGLLCDATRLPLADHSVDYSLCVAVAHHLTDPALTRLFAELARVTRRKLILWDPVEHRASAVSRLLWHYDRGSYPRSAQTLCQALQASFTLARVEHPVIYHHYVLCVGLPHPARPVPSQTS